MEAESKVEIPITFVVLTFTELPEEQDQRRDEAKNLSFFFFFLNGVHFSFFLTVQIGLVKKNCENTTGAIRKVRLLPLDAIFHL